ncbi:MAG: glycosyltransferase [Candidatus Fermentibacteria bacterium]|nr:glycosyltransferase [Candidatus Fermentibacteria bacterium]
MKVALISPLPPFRGGIAQFGKMLFSALGKENCSVTGINYSHLYPGFLFPGRTQYEKGYSRSEGILHSYNPFSWKKTRQIITDLNPDLIISQWWHPFFSPCLKAVNPGNIKSVAICHNITPHESFPLAKVFSQRFFNRQDLLVVHSEQAEKEALLTGRKSIRLFHPIYDQYLATGLNRAEAREKLGLKPEEKALLFFGLVREYKGLDILIEACDLLPEEYRIIAAGENYTDHHFESPRLLRENSFIPDDDVGTWFNAADIVVLPYRRASQSGIAQIALAFSKPMVVTDKGGLAETIDPDKTGTIAEQATPESLAEAILKCSALTGKEITSERIASKASEFSWASYTKKLLEAIS